ncbi:unnamed protein product [Heterobilharzia americana]|nr:unnamed protein product [Heterobilharzia americana]CAH8581878.1 unnamed protein product [Heterobilharzia americana]
MYADDGCQIQTNEEIPVNTNICIPHQQHHWINDLETTQYSPTAFNPSSTYSSSSSPVTDPIFHTENILNPSVISDNSQSICFNYTENLNVPYQYIWDKADDYSLYPFSFRSCSCELQHNEENLHDESDFQNHQQITDVNGFSVYTSDYQSICETQLGEVGGKNSGEITTDHVNQLSNEMKFCNYSGYCISGRNQNSNTFQEDMTSSSWFDFQPFSSHSSAMSHSHRTTFCKRTPDESVIMPRNEILSKTYNDQCLVDYEIQPLPVSTEANSGSPFIPSTLSSSKRHSDIKVCKQKLSKSFSKKLSDDSLTENSLLGTELKLTGTTSNLHGNNNNGAVMAAASAALANLHHRGSLQLWQFLIALLDDKESQHLICWTGRTLEFKLNDPEEVARLWGIQKNRPAMNYDKLSRSLRYYYEKGIMQKVSGERYVYRFVYEPELLFSLAFPGEDQSSQLPVNSMTTITKTNIDSKLCHQIKQSTENALNMPHKMNPLGCCRPASNNFDKRLKDINTEYSPIHQVKFAMKRRHTDSLEEKVKYFEAARATTSDRISSSNGNHLDLSHFYEHENTASQGKSHKNINIESRITSNQGYTSNNENFLAINACINQNSHIGKEKHNNEYLRTGDILETNLMTCNNDSLTYIDWFDNLTSQQEQQPVQETTDFLNYYYMNNPCNYSSYQYNSENSMLQTSVVCGKNDVSLNDQNHYLSEILNETYNKEQERLSSSSSPPSSSSFTLSQNDRSVLSTPPPITANLQNIYEVNYELLVNNEKLSNRLF